MNIKISQLIVLMLFLTACSGAQGAAAPTVVQVDLEASAVTSPISPTQSTLGTELTIIEGTVDKVSASAGLITLMELVQGFDVIATTETTELIDGEGNELRLNQIERGSSLMAQGEPGQAGAFIAAQVLLYPPSGRQFMDFPVQLTYLGADGNVWLYQAGDQAPERVTSEATDGSSDSSVVFRSPRLSSDGALIAVERQDRRLTASMMMIESSLWVYEVSSRSAMKIYDQAPAGYDWQPGSHLLAYSPKLDEAYFRARGQVDPDFANSIVGFDYDSAATAELVSPAAGFALVRPRWSPSGRFLSFEEVQGYEGSGWFAYFDFAADRYASWRRSIGNYDWSPDEEWIIYDGLLYTGRGTEMIRLSDRAGLMMRPAAAALDRGVVAQPAFSPAGDLVAYLYYVDETEGGPGKVCVQQIDGDEPIELGAFDRVDALEWGWDDQTLVIEAAGPSGQQEILVTYLDSNGIDSIAIGTELSLAQRVPAGEGLSNWAAAERALRSFFEYLSAGNYGAAVDLYGGSYEIMREHNPAIPNSEPASLLQAACEINGAQCLPPAEIHRVQQADLAEGHFVFAVKFLDEDGSVLSLGSCCGGDSGATGGVDEFKFVVQQQSEYRYVVLDPPIYLP